jgi:hypothetical protein
MTAGDKSNMSADETFRAAFDNARTPRSPEYKAGVLALLKHKLEGAAPPKCPYQVGTAQADAWFSGTEEGNAILREQALGLRE